MKDTQTPVNGTATSDPVRAPLTHPSSAPVHYELVDKDGMTIGPFASATDAVLYAERLWPDQEQDEDRAGRGWDVQVVGAE